MTVIWNRVGSETLQSLEKGQATTSLFLWSLPCGALVGHVACGCFAHICSARKPESNKQPFNLHGTKHWNKCCASHLVTEEAAQMWRGDVSTDVTRRKNEGSPLQRPLVGRETHSKPKRKSVYRGGDTWAQVSWEQERVSVWQIRRPPPLSWSFTGYLTLGFRL